MPQPIHVQNLEVAEPPITGLIGNPQRRSAARWSCSLFARKMARRLELINVLAELNGILSHWLSAPAGATVMCQVSAQTSSHRKSEFSALLL